jgi:hypothetical protein
MHRSTLSALALCTLVALLPAPARAEQGALPAALRPARYFSISVEQGGRVVPIKNHQARLKRRPFDLLIRFARPDAVLVNTWTAPETFTAARAGAPLGKLRGFRQTGMAEGLRNKDRDLFLSPDCPQYIYFEKVGDHRFNKVTRQGQAIVGRRTVKQLFVVPTRKKVRLEQWRGKDLYIVLVKSAWLKDHSGRRELQRGYLRLRFVD